MSIRHIRGRIALGGVVAIALVASAVAQTGARNLPRTVQRLLECRKIEASPERLACYDAAVDDMGQALAKGDVVTIDHEQATTLRRQAFGFSLPSLSFLDRGQRPEAIDRMTAVAKNAYRRGDGSWVIELEDGAVWTQIDSEAIARAPRAGSSVVISKAAMGSYFLKVDGQRAVRARRTN